MTPSPTVLPSSPGKNTIPFQSSKTEHGISNDTTRDYCSECDEKRLHFSAEEKIPLSNTESFTRTLEIDKDDRRAESENEFIVWWAQPENHDPENPRNWSSTKKCANICTISFISFLIPLVSAILAPGVEDVEKEFHTSSPTFATFVVSIFVLGFACGPLLLSPLSEIYGRVIIYNVSNVLFLGFTLMCAASQNASMLLAARFLSGFAGVATITIGSGTISDIMVKHERGRAVSIWAVGTIFGPMIGPIIGGYVAQNLGWRWIFWIMSLIIGLVTIISFFVLRETYPPVLLSRKASRIRKQTGDSRYTSKLESNLTPTQLFKISIVRPMKLLVCYPIVTIMCTYVAILYAILYLLFTTYSFVFIEVYGFSTSATGLVFLAGGIGTLAGLLYVGKFSDRTLKKRAAAGKPNTPEDRLPLIITIPGSVTFPVGLFIYGWTADTHVHWIVPMIGTAITGFGSILIFIGVQTYLIDAFEKYAASVIAANAVLRGCAGAFLPLAGLPMYRQLGWGWGNTLLGFIALAFAPLPWVLGKYGAKIRDWKGSQVEL